MGKKIKSGAGDLVCASALPLDQQIERSNVESQRDTPRVKQRNLKRAKPDDEVCKKEVFCIIGKEFKKNLIQCPILSSCSQVLWRILYVSLFLRLIFFFFEKQFHL